MNYIPGFSLFWKAGIIIFFFQVLPQQRRDNECNGMAWPHACISPAAIPLRSGALPSFRAAVHTCASFGRHRHALACAATFPMGSGLVPRTFQLYLRSAGGFQRALLIKKLFNCQKGLNTRAFGRVVRDNTVAYIACNQAIHVCRSFKEAAQM
jgi:hypothetical protein